MQLMKLSDGGVSLEFAAADFDAIKTCLTTFGDWSVRHDATFDTIELGDIKLVHMNDWDDPCLISTSKRAAELLANIFEQCAPRSGETAIAA